MKKHLLLLHGALGAQDQLDGIAALLSPHFELHRFNFSGHGGQPFANGFSLQQFTRELLDFLQALPDEVSNDRLHIFGYSMGGYVATMAQVQRPGSFTRMATLATKWHWDEASAAKEVSMLNPGLIEEKVPAFARSLAQRHAPNDWKELVNKTAAMMTETGQRTPIDASMLAGIDVPVLYVVGDRDKTVSIEETLHFHRNCPGSSFAVLPATPHPFDRINEPLLARMLIDFFD